MATLEFALCLPLLVTVFLGTLDTCQMVFYQQALDSAAQEGALLAAQGATTQQIAERCEKVLSPQGIERVTVDTLPIEAGLAPPGEDVRVTIQLSCLNQMFFGPFHRNCILQKEVVARKRAHWNSQNDLSVIPSDLSLDPARLNLQPILTTPSF